jgi:hypothetical protein
MSKFIRIMGMIGLWLLLPSSTWAQGPNPAYYYHPDTDLTWAKCFIVMEGNSQLKIPFYPVVTSGIRRAPMGIGNYDQDILVEGPVVFVGNGIVKEELWNSYRGRRRNYTSGDIDVAGKVVLFCYDFPDKIHKEVRREIPLSVRIQEAASRNAAAVVVFSHRDQSPFLMVNFSKEAEIPNTPAIAINEKSFLDILLCDFDVDGASILKKWEETGEPPHAVELSAKIRIKIEGNFAKAETKNFLIRFRKDVFSEEEMEETVKVNEKSLRFLLDCFKADKDLLWKRLFVVYFRDFDSKVFYTHHMGWGKAGEEGVFMIYKGGGVPDFGLAVHENTHILTRLNWGDSTSFINEGLGMYTEALATDKDKNHLRVIQFLIENNLFPLGEMVNFNIGPSGLKTLVGYPASGSFIAFLMDRYGLHSVKDVTGLEGRSSQEKKKMDSWGKAFGKTSQELEKEWLYWLKNRYQVEDKYIQQHLEKISKSLDLVRVNPEILDSYVGQYQFSSNILTVTKEDSRLLLEAPGMGKAYLVPESETRFSVKTFDATIRFEKDEHGEVTHMVIHIGGGEMRAERIK